MPGRKDREGLGDDGVGRDKRLVGDRAESGESGEGSVSGCSGVFGSLLDVKRRLKIELLGRRVS